MKLGPTPLLNLRKRITIPIGWIVIYAYVQKNKTGMPLSSSLVVLHSTVAPICSATDLAALTAVGRRPLMWFRVQSSKADSSSFFRRFSATERRYSLSASCLRVTSCFPLSFQSIISSVHLNVLPAGSIVPYGDMEVYRGAALGDRRSSRVARFPIERRLGLHRETIVGLGAPGAAWRAWTLPIPANSRSERAGKLRCSGQ